MKTSTIGMRVRVVIQEPREYAYGCAAALNGKTGVVDEIQSNGVALVLFDTPAPTWWSHQTPAKAFWFEPKDLQLESSP